MNTRRTFLAHAGSALGLAAATFPHIAALAQELTQPRTDDDFWAFVQQFTVQALIASNLDALGWRRPATIAASAILFGLAHVPDWTLSGLCAAAGLAWTAVFLRTRNLVPIALTHAWIGTLLYYWLLERDPWLEMFPAAK